MITDTSGPSGLTVRRGRLPVLQDLTFAIPGGRITGPWGPSTPMVGLMLVRYVVRLEPLASADPEDVVRLITPNVQRYLTGGLDGLTG